MGMPPCRPAVDPSILIHRDPRAWEELLGSCVDLFIEKMRGVGVGDLRSLVDYSFEGPSAMWLFLRRLEFAGDHAAGWNTYVRERWVPMGARMRWPYMQETARMDDLRVRISPAFMLLPYDQHKETWRVNASTLLRYIRIIPTFYQPHYYLSLALPRRLRDLARNGYVWVANVRSQGRRSSALAEWLYWLDHGRMPHIDVEMGRFTPGSPLDKVINIRRGRDAEVYRFSARRKFVHFGGGQRRGI